MDNIEKLPTVEARECPSRTASFILQATSKIWSVSLSDLVIDLKAGKATGLTVPSALLGRADKAIE
jgi:hypothetical protein